MNQNNIDGDNLHKAYDAFLAPFAQKNGASRGRKHEELPDPERLPFQRDRSRIINTNSFRRLKGKMQVVSPHKSDHFRNRLSHTLEVAQIARDLARSLGLNEDLAEAVALAHDLGHPPFGHSGEKALDLKMREQGSSFEHNKQSLRIVEIFESRYLDFPGLNLTYEVLEGIQKHETFFDRPQGNKIFTPHLEAQLVDIADEIAYLSADLEDGMRGDFFEIKDLLALVIPGQAIGELKGEAKFHRPAIIRRIIGNFLAKIVMDTKENLNNKSVQSLKDVQNLKTKIVSFDEEWSIGFKQLRQFLWDRYYSAPEILAVNTKGQEILANIFDFLIKNPQRIPDNFMVQEKDQTRRVCDYIAGMTDEFAEKFGEEIS